jgi:hypothetical protein
MTIAVAGIGELGSDRFCWLLYDLTRIPKLSLFTDLQEQKRRIALSLPMSGIVVLSGLGHL